ncbi:hypothetical protein F511_05858 [Dorcoceras hygrometricum]|uniref:Uncharacterized protein n=1 Tax=Dorcoceras hygrometricum TaxID=472368 RepID=A0A2Z7CWP9_9LAMI|nr:hypothetical protein F511_05858 [Dorcoceras hygrometricum]
MLEQHEDQEQSMKSSSSAESRAELKSIIIAHNDIVENGSSTDQVQCTREVFKCRAVYKSSDQVQEWSKAGASNQLEEQERTEQAQLQTKRGADVEDAPEEDQLEDENKEAGEEKESSAGANKETGLTEKPAKGPDPDKSIWSNKAV